VLLTLRFFARVLRRATTAVMSFRARRQGQDFEADLALFCQEMVFGRARRELVFAECKTYNRFTTKDVDRMDCIARSFPGAIIVFATLNEQLSQKEIRLLSPLARRGRRFWRDGRSHNPVLVLTGTELFADQGVQRSWKKRGGKHEAFANKHRLITGLVRLCDLTQQLYLDMPSFDQRHEERWQQRKLVPEKRRTAT